MQLVLTVEGASEPDLERGVAAAVKVFEDAGIGPLAAAEGMAATESWDAAGFPDKGEYALSDENSKAADVWMKANEAALQACYGWPEPRAVELGHLEVVLTDEEMERLRPADDDQEEEYKLPAEYEEEWRQEHQRLKAQGN